jgi:hypothetical protein
MADIYPTHFVVQGVSIKSRFVNEDTGEGYKYYDGNVDSVTSYGRDADGTYVSCNITYDDGEIVTDACLYDKDFENEDSDDAWYFVTKDSMLFKWMHQISKDTKELKQTVASLQPLPGSDFSSEDSDALESSDCNSVYDVPVENQRSLIVDLSKVLLNLAASGLLFAYSYKLAIDYKFI